MNGGTGNLRPIAFRYLRHSNYSSARNPGPTPTCGHRHDDGIAVEIRDIPGTKCVVRERVNLGRRREDRPGAGTDRQGPADRPEQALPDPDQEGGRAESFVI